MPPRVLPLAAHGTVTAQQQQCLVEMREIAREQCVVTTNAQQLARERQRARGRDLCSALQSRKEFDALLMAEGVVAGETLACGREELCDRVTAHHRLLHRAKQAVLQADADAHLAERAMHSLSIATGDMSATRGVANARRSEYTAHVRMLRADLSVSQRALAHAQ